VVIGLACYFRRRMHGICIHLVTWHAAQPAPVVTDTEVGAQITHTLGKFDFTASVRGGGEMGQAQAVRHALTRALERWDPALRPPLKRAGFITRDPRMVERKKPGRKKARKAFQWVKR
jgi:ribosomal protein S9